MLEKIQNLDELVLKKIYKFRTPFLDKIMIFFTNLGSKGSVWLLLGFFLLFSDSKKKSVYIFAVVSISAFVSELIIKNIVKRPRPCDKTSNSKLLVLRPTSYSFPSGHTTSSFASAILINYLSLEPFIVLGSFLVAIIISFSRIYLKVHYPSDIIAGIILGYFCANVVANFKT